MGYGDGGGEETAIEPVARLARRLEQLGDPATRAAAKDLVAAVLAWHADGLRRLTAALAAEPGGAGRLGRLAQTPAIASLLLLHGLHPEDFATRVRRGLGSIAALAAARGGELELVETLGERVRLRWRGAGAAPARRTIELAVWAVAPDAAEVVVEGAMEGENFVPVEALARAPA